MSIVFDRRVAHKMPDIINQRRRRFLGAAGMTIAAAPFVREESAAWRYKATGGTAHGENESGASAEGGRGF
jgi:hypothetical protein